jgi:hypothetical protein
MVSHRKIVEVFRFYKFYISFIFIQIHMRQFLVILSRTKKLCHSSRWVVREILSVVVC